VKKLQNARAVAREKEHRSTVLDMTQRNRRFKVLFEAMQTKHGPGGHSVTHLVGEARILHSLPWAKSQGVTYTAWSFPLFFCLLKAELFNQR
jgi:hypothetical protein